MATARLAWPLASEFQHLLAPYLNNLSDVCVHFTCETATACTDDLEPLDSVLEKDVAASIASTLTFDGNLTNLECAVEYATACAGTALRHVKRAI